MLKINDNYYELNLIDVIYELKKQLAEKSIFLFNQIKELPDDIMVSCPFHKNGQERKASCGLKKEDGYMHCFACGESLPFSQMISRCFGIDDLGHYGLNWLKNNFLGDILQSRNIDLNLTRKPIIKSNQYISEEELSKYRYYHPYMYKRKLTDKIIEIFDVRI